jgi:hypothetical protein
MTKFKCNLTLEDATDIQFTNLAGANTGKIESDGNNLVLSNAVGDILLGDGASDIYIGNGTDAVDVLFEVSGSLSAESNATLTLGGEGGTLALGSALALGSNNLTGGGTITGTTLTGTSLDMNGDADISGSLNLGSYTVASQGNQSLSGKITSFQNSGSTNLYLGIKNAAYPNRGWAFNPITSGVNCNLVIKEHGSDADRIKISTGGNFEVLTGSVTATGLDINGAATIDGTTTITSSSTAALKIVGGTGVDTTGSFVLRQNGDGAGNGMAITSSNATSHRLWKDASGNFNIGSSSNSNAFKQDATGNVTIEGTVGSGAITSTGKVTGTELEGTSLDINGRVDLQAISTSSDGTVMRGGFLNPAAEASMVHIPHLINDLAGFQKWSNSTITVTGLYKTRGGSSGSYTYSNAVAESDFSGGQAFDAHSSTAGSWYSDNGADGSTTGVGVITLEWTNELTYSAWAGIVFGSGSFTAPRVKIEAYRGQGVDGNGNPVTPAWEELCNITDNSENVVLRQIASNSGTNSATTKLRYTLGGSVNGSYFRIHTLYAANYRAGDNSLNNTSTAHTQGVNFLERYKDGYLHGSLYPGTDDTYDLGSSNFQWKNGYFDGTVNADGLDVGGNIAVSGTVDGIDIATRDAILTSTTTTAGAALPKAGGDMTGAIAMGNQNITGAGTITGTTLTGTSLDINGAADISGNLTGVDTLTATTLSVTNYGLASGDIPNNAANTTGTAATATLSSTTTVTDHSTNNINYPVVWHNNANALYDTASKFTFNPSTGALTTTTLSATNYGLASGDIPNNAANTTGTAAGLSATLAIASGGTAAVNSNGWLNSRITTSADGSLKYDATSAVAVNHDSLAGFEPAEHVDWAASGAGTIHASNYIENVAGNLGVTANGTSLTVTTTNGTNIAIPAATGSAQGVMTPELVAAISANTAKETNEGEPDAEEGTRGIIALATVEEATAGSDEVKAVTSAGVLQSIVTRKVHELAAPTSALAMNSQKVTGVANPTAAQDVATKAYVDGARVQQIVNLKGYATLQNDVYDYANPYNTDDEAPFQFDVSYGSGTINSSTEVNQSKLFRSGGFHVPFSCTVSSIQAQLTCNNDGNVSIALVEYRPSDAGGDTSDYPRVVYETVVVDSANNNNKVSSTTIAVGDLDNNDVPAGSHLMIMVKGDGTTAGGTAVFSVAIGLSW